MTTTNPTISENDNVHDIDISPQAVVEWIGEDGQAQHLSNPDPARRNITCDIRLDSSSHAAFFRLRIPIVSKRQKKATCAFVFIPPERIIDLTYDESNLSDTATKKLGNSTTCLRFGLDDPATLVVPRGPLALKQSSEDVLETLRSLTRQTSFAIYTPSTALSRAALRYLCTAASNKGLKSIPGLDDMTSLYGGQGGKTAGTLTTPAGSPPSYDELGPSPPPPQTFHNIKKRRRESNPQQAEREDNVQLLERICAKMMEDKAAELRASHRQDLEQVEARITDRMEQLFEKQQQWLEGRLDVLDKRVQGVVDETNDVIIEEIEAKTSMFKEDLEDFIRGEMMSAEESIKNDLSGASVSLQFD